MHVQCDSNIVIDAGIYIDNHATGMGGVLYIRGGSLAIATASTFSGNTASIPTLRTLAQPRKKVARISPRPVQRRAVQITHLGQLHHSVQTKGELE